MQNYLCKEDIEMEEKVKQLCPACGCVIGSSAYNKDGKAYCCEPCASNKGCECGCCKEVKGKK